MKQTCQAQRVVRARPMIQTQHGVLLSMIQT
jgi:hypothetical protein